MTLIFYKVGSQFTRLYSEAIKLADGKNYKIQTLYVEYPHIDYLEAANKITLEDLINKYNVGYARCC